MKYALALAAALALAPMGAANAASLNIQKICQKPEMKKIIHRDLPSLVGLPWRTKFKIAKIGIGIPVARGFSCGITVIWPTGVGETGFFGFQTNPRTGNTRVLWQHGYYFPTN